MTILTQRVLDGNTIISYKLDMREEALFQRVERTLESQRREAEVLEARMLAQGDMAGVLQSTFRTSNASPDEQIPGTAEVQFTTSPGSTLCAIAPQPPAEKTHNHQQIALTPSPSSDESPPQSGIPYPGGPGHLSHALSQPNEPGARSSEEHQAPLSIIQYDPTRTRQPWHPPGRVIRTRSKDGEGRAQDESPPNSVGDVLDSADHVTSSPNSPVSTERSADGGTSQSIPSSTAPSSFPSFAEGSDEGFDLASPSSTFFAPSPPPAMLAIPVAAPTHEDSGHFQPAPLHAAAAPDVAHLKPSYAQHRLDAPPVQPSIVNFPIAPPCTPYIPEQQLMLHFMADQQDFMPAMTPGGTAMHGSFYPGYDAPPYYGPCYQPQFGFNGPFPHLDLSWMSYGTDAKVEQHTPRGPLN